MNNLTVKDLNKKIPFDIVELICKKVYLNRKKIIQLKIFTFNKWRYYSKLYKLNLFINTIIYNSDRDLMPNLNNNYNDLNNFI